ncbi:hypothetical protein AWN68_14490 [Roseivirga echinicomitans]|uniref:Permease n=2 Tax=Roseivirga echinicomitans TaxID=296218 RepID=A0A150XUP2_9BACT|nr:hypothetical protein AWN68_14490 [Roseivirga echinicomitans]
MAIIMSLTLFTLIILSLFGLLSHQFSLFMEKWPLLEEKVLQEVQALDEDIAASSFQFMIGDQGVIKSILTYASNYLVPALPEIIYQSSISLVLIFLIPVYAALILFYRRVLVHFLYYMLPKSAHHYIETILPNVIVTYYNFIKGVGMVYLVVGILNSLGLWLIGIPNPIFFGFVASILTFIPYVGITIGALLPMAVSWLQFDSFLYPLGVIAIFSFVQILEANLIFPLAVSNRLKMNALVTLIVIIGGGIIWGASGMILFLPFAGILKLIADQVEDMKPISVLLGTNKDLEEEED